MTDDERSGANDAFLEIASRAFDGLPENFREAAGNLVLQVSDWPDGATLSAMGIGSAFGLLGLYHGVGLPYKSIEHAPHGPDVIELYRHPIIAYAREAQEPLEAVIAHVLIHEIGHHFGFSDADMDAIDAAPDE